MKKSFKNYCKQYVLDHIDEYEYEEPYGCDFCTIITEDINRNPHSYFSREEAFGALKAWMEEAALYWEYEKFSFGEHLHNPFENPECYVACMVIVNIRGMLGSCDVISESWNDRILISRKEIKRIKSYVRKCNEKHFF